MSDSAYSDYNKFQIEKHEADYLKEIRHQATKGNWDEVSRLFSEIPGLNSPKGFVSSKDLLHIIDAPKFADSYGFDASLKYIFDSLHYWVYPGRKAESDKFFPNEKQMPDNIFIDIPSGLKVWPREFNNKGRNPEAVEEINEEIIDIPVENILESEEVRTLD